MACQLAIDGAGVAVFDRVSARGFDMRNVVLRPLEPERWISFGYVHHRDQKPTGTARVLIDCVLHTIESFRNESAESAASIEPMAARKG